jgi:polyhydroxyalkanoate synthase
MEANGGSEAGIDEIDGLGSTYADRLVDVGIETMADLSAAGAETVAEAAEVSEDRAEEWIAQAEN